MIACEKACTVLSSKLGANARLMLKDVNKPPMMKRSHLSLMAAKCSKLGASRISASRVLVLAYGLLAMISLHLYTGTLASKIVNERLAGQINSKSDLVGKKVGTWSDDVALFRKYSIKAEAFPWEDEDHMLDMLEMLRRHKYEALILDTPAVMHYTSTAPGCDLFPAGEPFDTFYVAIGFPADAPDDLTLNVSASIVRLQTLQGVLDRLENEYINGGTGGCTYTLGEAHNRPTYQISMEQVRGLWLILGVTAGLCLAWAGIQYLRNSQWGQKHLGRSAKVADSKEATAPPLPDSDSGSVPRAATAEWAAEVSKAGNVVQTLDKLQLESVAGNEVSGDPAVLLAIGDGDGALHLSVQVRTGGPRGLPVIHSSLEGAREPALFNDVPSQHGSS